MRQVAELRSAGKLDQAGALLEQLCNNPEIHILGQTTSLGMPRQLQSALLGLAKSEQNSVASIGYQFYLVPPVEVLTKHAKFSSDERRAIVSANARSVPRVIHQIWIGKQALPATIGAWIRHCNKHGYTHRLWQEEDLRRSGFDQHPMYQHMITRGDLPGAVDVARYQILEQHGGIYLDCDWFPARDDLSFHDLLPLKGLIAMAEPIPRNTGKGGLLLANSMIATPADHPVFSRLIESLKVVLHDLPDSPAWWSTGPLIFTLMSRGGTVTLADDSFVAGSLPRESSLKEIEAWCKRSQAEDKGLLLLWKSWVL